MRAEIKWYAFDDAEFDDVRDCVEYEDSFSDIFKSVQFFNEDLKVLDDLSEIESDAVYFIILDSDKCQKLFKWMYDNIGMELPNAETYTKGDIWVWDLDGHGVWWVNATQRYQVAKEQYEKLKSAFSKVFGEIDG